MKQLSKSSSRVKEKVYIEDMQINLIDDGAHYIANKFYSYNCFLGLIDGGRGIGKTTTFLWQGLRESKKGNQFIYLRRYKTEIKEFVNKDSMAPLVDGINYQGDGGGGYTMKWNNITLGYCIALSTARAYKSVDFSKVTLLVFDEGFVKNTPSYRYLKDEVTVFLEFVSTVVRTRKNVRVVILGNNEDMFSPYHSFWNIPMFKGIYVDKEHGIYCEHAKNSAKLLAKEKETGLYSLIKDTSYGAYHYDNEVLGTEDVNIIEKPKDAKLSFRVIINGHTCSCYTYWDKKELLMYCDHKDKIIQEGNAYIITNNGNINYLNVELFRHKIKKWLYFFYFNNKVSYNDSQGGAILAWIVENV